MSKSNKLGIKGEIIAREYLKNNNYSILHQNYRFGRKEIDIIVEKDGLLIFVEVKTRRSHDFGFPEEAVSEEKIANIKEVAEDFLWEHPEYEEIRFDIISITIPWGKEAEIFHIKDAFF